MVNKQQDPTDIWAWVRTEIEEYRKKGERWEVMADNFAEFMSSLDDNNRSADITIARALEEAKALGDVRWELLIRHWRLQHWLRQSQTKRALPEAIDLMTLATDPQVRDVPQRICAYHDVVECFLEIDPVGYHTEIAENSQEILAQLPQRHSCATCARSNWMKSAAAAGNVEEAEHLIKQTQSWLNEKKRPATLRTFAETYELIGKLDEAELYFKEASNLAREQKDTAQYLKSILPLARVLLTKSDVQAASRLIHQARQISKSKGGPEETVLLLALEGRLAFASNRISIGADYLTRAAQIYLDMGCYRDAAQSALDVAELLKKASPAEESSENKEEANASMIARALDVAAQAIGQLPPVSKDLYTRLEALDRKPITPSQSGLAQEVSSADELDARELALLQELLQGHIANGHLSQIVVTLYQIGRWYGIRNQNRAALDYLIASAALERLFKVDADERGDTLGTLKGLQKSLPAGTVEAALTSQEASIPEWLAPLLQNVPIAQWGWIIRAIGTEMRDEPIVEPEPKEEDATTQFNDWLEYAASLTALIVRFYPRIEEKDLQSWWDSLTENHAQVELNVRQFREADAEGNEANIQQGLMIASFMQGLLTLAHGTAVEAVVPNVLPPLNQIIEQIGDVAQRPVWFHPGSTPIDYLVEQAAQETVAALRKQDEHRLRRLTNLILRYKLMNIDIQPEEELKGIARFLEALQQLLLLDGKELPVLNPPLDAPFNGVLSAIYASSQQEPKEPHESGSDSTIS
jgi:MalT-like TPR region